MKSELFMYKYIFVFSFIFAFTLYASSAEAYINAVKLYHEKMYKDAYPIIQKEAIKGNKEAQYLLAHMYEYGQGIEKDMKKALSWYKKTSFEYSYIVKEKPRDTEVTIDNLEQRVEKQMNHISERKMKNFLFSKIDSSTPEVKSKFMKILENNFGLLPYKTNYLIPFSYSSIKYKRHFSAYKEEDIPKKWQDKIGYKNHIETEYQLSFQKPLTFDLIGWNESISFAYTQQVWWKFYDKSAPFRETNYLPELFMIIPTSDSIDKDYNLKAIKFGYLHQSNGQEGYQSRSWNRLFFATLWQYKSLFIKAKGWYRLPENSGDDNPDISDYMGHGELELNYLFGKDQINFLWRNNLKTNKNRGAILIDYSTPFFSSDNTYWYIKLFSGYGESMINYNNSVNKISIGFAYSRGVL